jgi:hypothetical protein
MISHKHNSQVFVSTLYDMMGIVSMASHETKQKQRKLSAVMLHHSEPFTRLNRYTAMRLRCGAGTISRDPSLPSVTHLESVDTGRRKPLHFPSLAALFGNTWLEQLAIDTGIFYLPYDEVPDDDEERKQMQAVQDVMTEHAITVNHTPGDEPKDQLRLYTVLPLTDPDDLATLTSFIFGLLAVLIKSDYKTWDHVWCQLRSSLTGCLYEAATRDDVFYFIVVRELMTRHHISMQDELTSVRAPGQRKHNIADCTILQVAIQAESPNVIALLIEWLTVEELDVSNPLNGHSAVMTAVICGDIQAVESILNKTTPMCCPRDHNGYSLTELAINWHQVDVMRLLRSHFCHFLDSYGDSLEMRTLTMSVRSGNESAYMELYTRVYRTPDITCVGVMDRALKRYERTASTSQIRSWHSGHVRRAQIEMVYGLCTETTALPALAMSTLRKLDRQRACSLPFVLLCWFKHNKLAGRHGEHSSEALNERIERQNQMSADLTNLKNVLPPDLLLTLAELICQEYSVALPDYVYGN